MYLRETRRRNRNGSEVSYLALAHNERDPDTGMPRATIIHSFGRADQVDREGLARLVRSISRFLDPAEAVAAGASGEVRIIDARPMGTSWVVARLWERLGIAKAIMDAAAGRRADPVAVERVAFAMVANRLSPTPLSKLAGCAWVSRRVYIEGLAELTDDACYRTMDFLLQALPEIQEAVFFSVANLLNLEVDIVFFDTTSTYWEADGADPALLDDDEAGGQRDGGAEVPGEVPRYHTVAGNLRVKEVRVDDGTARDRFVVRHNPEQATRDAEVRAQIVERLQGRIAGTDALGAKKRAELAGQLRAKPSFARFLRETPSGKLRIDRARVATDAHFDGKFLLRTSDESLTAADIAEGYKGLYEAERGWRDLKSTLDLRPVYHYKQQRIEAHVQLCWLALLILRVAEITVADTWRNIRDELERLHLVTLATAEGQVAQLSELTA